jgi:hypothetical protein
VVQLCRHVRLAVDAKLLFFTRCHFSPPFGTKGLDFSENNRALLVRSDPEALMPDVAGNRISSPFRPPLGTGLLTPGSPRKRESESSGIKGRENAKKDSRACLARLSAPVHRVATYWQKGG